MPAPADRRFAADLALGILVPSRTRPHRRPWSSACRASASGEGPAALVLVAVGAGLLLARVLASRRPDVWWRSTRPPAWRLLVACAACSTPAWGWRHASRDPGLGRRAALPGDGAEPVARPRPGPARRVRRGRSGPSSCLGRCGRTGARPAPTAGRFRPTARACPLLLAPAYAALGREGCVLLMALLAAARGARLPAAGAPGSTGDAGRRRSRPGSPRVGPPLFFYSFHLYTEAPSALAGGRLAAAAARSARRCRGRRSRRSPPPRCPWLHVKMIPAAAALGLVALVRLRGRALAAFLLVARRRGRRRSASTTGRVFGVASPLALYGGVPADARVPLLALARGPLLRLLLRLAADRARGSCWRSPGCPLWLRRHVALGGTRSWAWPCWRRSCRGACGGEASARRPGSSCRCCRFWLLQLALRLAASTRGPGTLVARALPDRPGALGRGRGRAGGAARSSTEATVPRACGRRCRTATPLGDYLPTLTHASGRDNHARAVVAGGARSAARTRPAGCEAVRASIAAFGEPRAGGAGRAGARRGDRPDRGTAPRPRAAPGTRGRSVVSAAELATQFDRRRCQRSFSASREARRAAARPRGLLRSTRPAGSSGRG